MFCKKCGTAMANSDNFCGACGAKTAGTSSISVAEPPQIRIASNDRDPYIPPKHLDTSGSASISALVLARITFALGFLAILYMSGIGIISEAYTIYVVLGYVFFCEYVVARRIKSKMASPMNAYQRNLTLLPWLITILGIVGVILLPMIRG